MPRAFRTYPKHPAVALLVKLHADIGGRLKANRDQADLLMADMKHVEAVIRMFDPAYDMHRITLRQAGDYHPNDEGPSSILAIPWSAAVSLNRCGLMTARSTHCSISSRSLTGG
jgi:hypothetical protein